jgi:hypothetical protein
LACRIVKKKSLKIKEIKKEIRKVETITQNFARNSDIEIEKLE